MTKLQRSTVDSVIISIGAFCSMSVIHPLVQLLRSVVIIFSLFHRWGLWSYSSLRLSSSTLSPRLALPGVYFLYFIYKCKFLLVRRYQWRKQSSSFDIHLFSSRILHRCGHHSPASQNFGSW